jgi:hypothetical protein
MSNSKFTTRNSRFRKLFKEHYLKSHQQQLINNLQARATSTTPISQ